MAGKNRGRSGDKAVAYFAAAFVVAAGLLFGSVTILLFSPDTDRTIAIGGGIIIVIVILVWLIRDHSDGRTLKERYGPLLGFAPKKEKVKVKVKRVKPSELPGSNRPPTAEDIRNLSGGVNTWVPSSGKRQSDEEL